MTLCNMSIEAGARAGLVAVDDTTLDYVQGRPFAPEGAHGRPRWRTGARCTATPVRSSTQSWMDASEMEPQVTWGTSPEMVAGVGERVPIAAA